jgi:hypothetical protein
MQWGIDSTYNYFNVENVYGTIRNVVIDVIKPFTGTGTPTVRVIPQGASLSTFNLQANFTIAGRREISTTAVTGAQTGDILAPLLTGQYVNQIQISNGNLTATPASQQGLYRIIITVDKPYMGLLQ